MVFLKVSNIGATPAYGVSFSWDRPLVNLKGEQVSFSSGEASKIAILYPSQSISKTVNEHEGFFKTEGSHQYTGTIEFQNAQNRQFNASFILDGDVYLDTPLYETDELRVATNS